MTVTEIQRRAVLRCIAKNVPFALYALPGVESAEFIACRPDDSDECRNEWRSEDSRWQGFFINFFANDEAYTPGVRREFDAAAAIEYADSLDVPFRGAELELQTVTTDRLKYISIVSGIIARLKKMGGKTVYSRLETIHSDADILDVALEYFKDFGGSFRYIAFTSETGIWLGATPELVGCGSRDGGKFTTMAMAGTMPAEFSGEWDSKNLEEHLIVVKFIADVINGLGGKVNDMEARELSHGIVKHLVTVIDATLPACDPRKILCSLSPTPAIGGYPREIAIKEIFCSELHSRHCYGGFVGVTDGNAFEAYANLRCAMAVETGAGGSDYNVFSGGGITAASIPENEWDEAVAKTEKLINAIKLTH